MSQTRDFFAERPEWSEWKHDILADYLPVFARILGKNHPIVHYVDAFAGPGYYGTGDTKQPGSPVIAARTAEYLEAKSHVHLRCINVEAKAKHYASLVTNTAAFDAFTTNRFGRFGEQVREVLTMAESTPAFFFIDPFGVADIEWTTIQKLARRKRPTELLINFNVPGLNRVIGFLDSPPSPARDANISLVNGVFGGAEWQDIVKRDSPSSQRRDELLNLYLERVSSELHFNAGAYAIRTLRRQALKYYLIFGTRNDLGLGIMGDIVAAIDKRYKNQRTALLEPAEKQLPLGLFPDDALTEAELIARSLKTGVLEVVRRCGEISFGGVRRQMDGQWWGAATEGDFRRACRELREEGLIVCSSPSITKATLLRVTAAESPSDEEEE